MPLTLRLLRPTLALLALGAVIRAPAQSGSAASPFMPPAAAMVSTAPSENLEFAGLNVMPDKTFVSVFDKQTKKSRWISVGGTEAGISVLAYDPRREQIVVKSGDIQKTLTLRKSSGAINAPTPVGVTPPQAGFNVAPPPLEFTKTQPPPPGSPAPTDAAGAINPGAPLPATPLVEAAPVKTEGPAKPLTVARQEEEARMLVSDLLEIGMAQRKAYEDAQKKAAAGPTGQSPTTASPTPGG